MTYRIKYDRMTQSYAVIRSDGAHCGWYATKAEAAHVIATGQAG